MKYLFRRGLNGLNPFGEDAEKFFRTLKVGDVVNLEIRRPRNPLQHRLYWQLCRTVAMNHSTLTNEDMVHQAIKILTGHVDIVRIGDDLVQIPRSIAFDKMDQVEFDEFFERAKNVVAEQILPGVGLRELQDEILRMVS